MPVIDDAMVRREAVAAWRRDIHAHPELLYDLPRTSGRVADLLRGFGCDEVTTGIGRTGVVGLIRGREAGPRTVGLRADMDALPMTEATGLPYASGTPGRMHACGHDGHTAMLLGAAEHLCGTRRFAGRVAVVFQPAEEGGAGARAMIGDGLMDRFAIDEVYGLHNLPGLTLGTFAVRAGPVMAAADRFEINIEGRGGHAAMPHLCADPVHAGAAIVMALQGIVARNLDPLDAAVLSVTQFNAGTAQNAIPTSAKLAGTFRTLRAETRAFVETRLRAIAAALGEAHGVTTRVTVNRGYPVTRNHAGPAAFAARVARDVAGPDGVDDTVGPMMGAEDFAYMLEARPGAFVLLGIGDRPGLHSPAYDFNDDALPFGISFWVRLVETALPLGT